MSIRIQRCHPQVHATHIDFTVTHSLKRFPEAKSLSFSSDTNLSLTLGRALESQITSKLQEMCCERVFGGNVLKEAMMGSDKGGDADDLYAYDITCVSTCNCAKIKSIT